MVRIGDNVRELTDHEQNTAYAVFLDTIDYDFVRISDGLGLDSRPFTFPVPLAISAKALWENYVDLMTWPIDTIPVARLIGKRQSHIYINFGTPGYANALYDKPKFIHEMTHVWQYQHGIDVAKRSIAIQGVQAVRGKDPYDYDKPPTGDWGDYNVEQQAQIIGDWVKGGYKQDANFGYIRDYIRKGITDKMPLVPGEALAS